MGVKTVKRSDTERRKTRSRVECPRKQKTTQETATVGYYHPFAAAKKIPAMQISMHKHIHARTDNPRNADSNWSSCAFSVERESEQWYKEEFQISKTIFHFPPSAGIWDLTILWKHSTSETYSSTNAAHMLSLSWISAPPKLKTRTNASVLYAGTQQVAG